MSVRGEGLGGGHGRNGRGENVLYITLDSSILLKGFKMLLTIGSAGEKRDLGGNTLSDTLGKHKHDNGMEWKTKWKLTESLKSQQRRVLVRMRTIR